MSTFSDTSDHATELEMREREILLQEHKRRVEAAKLKPVGRCYNCDEEIAEGKVFCDADCAADFEHRKQREKVLGLGR